eukprot:scaffold66225_cov78-Cyclotella_meneghiniana.AAC.3
MERRKLKNHGRSSMTPEREALLDGLGFDWGKEKGQAIWDEKFVSRKQLVSRLNSSTARHGHCIVKTKDRQYKTLGRWVTSQRSDYKNDRMDQDKIDKLNEVGFVWDYFKDNPRRDS